MCPWQNLARPGCSARACQALCAPSICLGYATSFFLSFYHCDSSNRKVGFGRFGLIREQTFLSNFTMTYANIRSMVQGIIHRRFAQGTLYQFECNVKHTYQCQSFVFQLLCKFVNIGSESLYCSRVEFDIFAHMLILLILPLLNRPPDKNDLCRSRNKDMADSLLCFTLNLRYRSHVTMAPPSPESFRPRKEYPQLVNLPDRTLNDASPHLRCLPSARFFACTFQKRQDVEVLPLTSDGFGSGYSFLLLRQSKMAGSEACPPESEDPIITSRLRAFLDWFKRNGGELHEDVALSYSSSGGIHLKLKDEAATIPEGTKVVSCPYDLTLSGLISFGFLPAMGQSQYAIDASVNSLMEYTNKARPQKVPRPTCMTASWLGIQKTAGAQSCWKEYIDCLPGLPEEHCREGRS